MRRATAARRPVPARRREGPARRPAGRPGPRGRRGGSGAAGGGAKRQSGPGEAAVTPCVCVCVCVAGGRPTPPAAARPEMPGVLPSDGSAPPRGSPSRKNRLSLKLFQKKEAKRALDFTEPPENEQKGAELRGAEMYVGVRVLPEPRYLAAAPRVAIPLLCPLPFPSFPAEAAVPPAFRRHKVLVLGESSLVSIRRSRRVC